MEKEDFAERFEDLRISQGARKQAGHLYRNFGEASKAARDFGFRDQIQRAGVSVMNNIAEGFERGSQADFDRFLKFAKGSCGEVRSMLYLAEDLGYLPAATASADREFAEGLSRSIASLEKSIRTKLD